MKKMARIVLGFVFLIYMIEALPSLLPSITRAIKTVVGTAGDTLQDTLWDTVDNITDRMPYKEEQASESPNEPEQKTTEPQFIKDKNMIKVAQELLNQLGYDAGTADGILGPKTRSAMNCFQADKGLPVTDDLSDATYKALLAARNGNDVENGDYCPIHGYFYAFGDECCGCIGSHIFGDDPSYCLSCKDEFDVCEHDVSYSEHPHIYAFCTKCGVQFYDQFQDTGRELSYCEECFPQNTLNKEHLLKMAELSLLAYNTRYVVDESDSVIVKPTGTKGIYTIYGSVPYDGEETRWINALRINQGTGYTESLIDVSNTADGKLIMTISFEGSYLPKEWPEDYDEAQQMLKDMTQDWLITDFRTGMNPDGVHKGFASRTFDYIYGIFNGEYYIDATIDGVTDQYRLGDIMAYIQKNKDAHLRITGHSLGGAMAQTLAYYLVKGELYQIPSEQIEVYTFASPTPFGYQAVESATFRNMNIYNFINVQDFVPNFGVTICDGIVVRLAELAGYQLSADFFDNEADGGFTQAGTNLGTNIYVNAGDQHDGFKEHSMNETYLKLVKAYIKGDIEAYEFDTDVFFSKYYDMRSHQAKNSFIDELDHIATVLKITNLFSE
ncbi:MAG: peptidoglycan-binding protein [Eubacteriales bacterium]|nr:peptidoglycan-binding protein [Eubacteriales bacterium]